VKLLLCLIVLAAFALALSACSQSDPQAVQALEVDTAKATDTAQRAQILAALEPLDPLRYHHLDRIIREEESIPSDAVIWARRAREVLDWVDWPAELVGHVDQYADWLDSLLAAFRNDDARAADEPSRIVHALAHTFEVTLEAWLSSESLPAVPELAGLEPPSHDEHGGHSSMSDDQQHQMQDDQQSSMQHDEHDQDQMQHGDDDEGHDEHE